jgi:hypothetical protein
MKHFVLALFLIALAPFAAAAALGTATRNVIPSDVQQIISVDYRQLSNSPVAGELHDRALPDNMKQFESALKGVGISPDRDIDHLTFASFRDAGQIRLMGVADGQFALKSIFAKLRAKKIKPSRYHTALLYPMGNGFEMTLLDDSTLLFGDLNALKASIQARDGQIRSLNANGQLTDIMPGVESGAVWSVLDGEGTQTMMRSALGDASRLADYETIKKRLLASRYQMNFDQGVKFDLDVITSDSVTAATLSTVVKAGMLYKKMQVSGPEKAALDSMSVESDSDQLRFHFRADDKKFQSLLNSELFAAVSR